VPLFSIQQKRGTQVFILKVKYMKKINFNKIEDKILEFLFFLSGFFVILALSGIFLLVLKTALQALKNIPISEFLFKFYWNPTSYTKPTYGMLSMIMGTFIITFFSLLFAIPIGIASAIFISEIASHKFKEFIKPIIELLAAIPSVVLGFFGIVVLGPYLAKIFNLNTGLNALNGSILVSIIALPTIISISEDALNRVPKSYEEASYALGATKFQTLLKIKIPSAMSGIISGCLLGMGRIIGETMTVLMAAGCAASIPKSIFDPVRSMTATIAIELGEVAFNTDHYYALFVVGLLLFIITFIINLIADMILYKYQHSRR